MSQGFLAVTGRALVASACVALAGCVTTDGGGDFGTMLKDAVNKSDLGRLMGTSGAATTYTRIDDTPLADVLAESTPVKGSKDKIPYPRVALRVVGWDGSPIAAQYAGDLRSTLGRDNLAGNGRDIPSGCLKMTATLWKSPTQSQAVPQFAVCLNDLINTKATVNQTYASRTGGVLVKQGVGIGYGFDEALGIPYGVWTKSPGTAVVTNPNTGHKRTDGPLPPLNAFSVDEREYPEWKIIGPNGLLAQYLLYAMHHAGYYPDSDADGRLWVVSSTINFSGR